MGGTEGSTGGSPRTARRARVGVGATVAAFAVLGALSRWVVDAPSDQWTWTIHATGAAHDGKLDTRHVGLLAADLVLIAVYVGAAVAVHADTAGRARRLFALGPGRFRPLQARLHRWSLAGCTYLVLAAVADVVENGLVLRAAVVCDPDRAEGSCESIQGWLTALQAATWVKLIAFAAGVAALAITSLASLVRARDLGLPRERPEGDPPDDGWRAGRQPDPPEFAPRQGRRGVCLSGGGIRSASFSLGALQAMGRSTIDSVSYITSASGGGYMAAAWASLSRTSTPERKTFEPRSPEERWVRHHTDYLVSNAGSLIGAVLSLVVGLAINLVIVFSVLQMVAHPLGWIVGSAHPEQRAELPIVEVTSQPKLEVGAVREIRDAELALTAEECGCEPRRIRGTAYEVPLVSAEDGAAAVTLDLETADDVDTAVQGGRVEVTLTVRPGLVAEGDEGLEVLRQPLVTFSPPTTGAAEVVEHLELLRQPTLATDALPPLTKASGGEAQLRPEDVQAQVSVDRQTRLRQTTGTLGRDSLRYPAWMWVAVAGVLGAALVAWLLDRPLRRFQGDDSHLPAQGLAKLGTAAAALLLVVPFAARNVPTWLSRVPGYDPSNTRWQAVWAFLVVAVPAVIRLRGSFAKQIGKVKGFRGASLLLDLFLGIVVLASGLVVFLLLVDLASANGPSGRLAGAHDRWMWGWTDVRRWQVGLVVPALIVVLPVSSHAWSLYTFYRSRLAASYFLQRVPGSPSGRVEPMPSRVQRSWQWSEPSPASGAEDDRPPAADVGPVLADLSWATVTLPLEAQGTRPVGRRRRPAPLAPEPPGPGDEPVEQWVVCTTANIRGAGEAAPGRGAGSFTFSHDWVGGPDVGWMRTEEYLARLGRSRRCDVAVPSTVTISGAAFSPAMGKASKSWQGRVFALLNLRLGVWVPNPMVVQARSAQGRPFGTVRRPNALWYLRELVGWFDRTAPYVYLTDGGHWDNLGLVELLRRGCTDVWMVSAAGDGTSSFETMAQAMALAREELGVEFELELEPLRAPAEVPEAVTRQLLRKKKGVPEDTPTAPASFVSGTFRFPGHRKGDEPGHLHVIEATVTRDLPWDVHGYAEANADFPDVSTGYQLMDHRDFEAYRMAGYTQMARALHAVQLWPDDTDPVVAPRVEAGGYGWDGTGGPSTSTASSST